MNYIYGFLGFCGHHTFEEKTITKRYYIAAKDATGQINDKLHVAREGLSLNPSTLWMDLA